MRNQKIMLNQKMWRHCCLLAIGAALGTIGIAQAAPFPYFNDFDNEALTNTAPQFTLDTDNGILHYVAGGGVIVSVATEPITGLGTSNFILSTRFTLNQSVGDGNAATMGFGALAATADLNSSAGPYYLCDWVVTPSRDDAGRLRILALGDGSDFSSSNSDSDGDGANASSLVIGNTYELRLSGTYTGSVLNLTLALFDGSGNQIGDAATATDGSPLAGEYFGYRNRVAHGSHQVDVSFDNFSVASASSPSVNAGPDQTISLSTGTATLDATVIDDGLPNPPGEVQSLWSVDSQPPGGNATFGDAAMVDTTVIISALGSYTLRLTACDDGAPGACNSDEIHDTMILTVEDRDTWDGGSPTSNNWSEAQNWFGDTLPDFLSGTTILEFAGSTRPTPNNDLANVDVATLLLNPSATAFTIGGNGLTIRESIRNESGNTQILNTGSIMLGEEARFHALNGMLDIDAPVVLPDNLGTARVTGEQTTRLDGPVTGESGFLIKEGVGSLVLSNNANDYLGKTVILDGSIEVSVDNALGSTTAHPYLDAAGDIGSDTVRASDSDPVNWFTSELAEDGLWGLREDFGNVGASGGPSVFECSDAGFVEDCPQLKTTLAGLNPGISYPVYIHYWSRVTREWAVRAGLTPGTMTLFDRTGALHDAETGTAGTPTGNTVLSGTLIELIGYLGDAVADGNGEIEVFIDDVPSSADGEYDRSWYDGISTGPDSSTLITGGNATGQLLISGGIALSEVLTLEGRANDFAHVLNSGGSNSLTGPLDLVGGSNYLLSSQSGLLMVSNDVTTPGSGTLVLRGSSSGEILGVISGGAAVDKLDNGTWTLAGENTYTGQTTVSEGTLALAHATVVNNISASPSVTVELGAELDVSGLAGGSLAVADGQTLVGAGTIDGGLTVGPGATVGVIDTVIPRLTITDGLTLQDGATLRMGLGLNTDLYRISGGTVTGANAGGVTVEIIDKDLTLTEGATYTVMDWSGAGVSGLDPEDFVLASPYMMGTFSISGNTLRFTYQGADDTGDRVLNGDFELWDDPPTVPDFWSISNIDVGIPVTQVLGLDGTGFAVELETIGGAAGGLFQTMPTELLVVGPFSLSMDFAFAAADDPGDDRVFNPSIREGTGTIRMNIRTAVDPNNPSGPQALEFHDGSSWNVVAADLMPSDFAGGPIHPYRMEITGDTTTESMFVTVTDLTTDTPVVSNFDASALWSVDPAPTGGLSHFRFDTQRIDAPYRVDNVELFATSATGGRFDFNGDEEVDDEDLFVFIECSTGPAVAGPPAGCPPGDFQRADDDDDGDVDLTDFAAFQRCLSAGGDADPDCL